METNKIGAQKRRTIRIIHDCFIELLKEKSLDKISVSELSEAADINRTTFYRYYTDVYALMGDVTDQLINRIFHNVIQDAPGRTLYLIILNALNQIKVNKEICKVLLCDQEGNIFESQLKQVFLEMVSLAYGKEYSGEAELQFNYMISGFIGMLKVWVKAGCTIDEKRLAQIAEKNINDTYNSINDMIME